MPVSLRRLQCWVGLLQGNIPCLAARPAFALGLLTVQRPPDSCKLTPAPPLMPCTAGTPSGIVNFGYWGVALKRQESYTVSLYLRTSEVSSWILTKVECCASHVSEAGCGIEEAGERCAVFLYLLTSAASAAGCMCRCQVAFGERLRSACPAAWTTACRRCLQRVAPVALAHPPAPAHPPQSASRNVTVSLVSEDLATA